MQTGFGAGAHSHNALANQHTVRAQEDSDDIESSPFFRHSLSSLSMVMGHGESRAEALTSSTKSLYTVGLGPKRG